MKAWQNGATIYDDLAIAGAKVFVRLPCPICRSAMRQRQSVV
jgi:cytidine deaminase